MQYSNLADQFEESNLRVEKLIHIATMALPGSMADDVFEAFEDGGDELWSALELDSSYDDSWEIWENLYKHKKLGFLGEFATPIPKYVSSSMYVWSWGRYTTKWIYAETLESLYLQAVDWQEKFEETQKQKFQSA